MNKIILIGMKACGKTTIGKILAQKLNSPFIELDSEIEKQHLKEKGEKLFFRDIFKKYGKEYFRNLETKTLVHLANTLKSLHFVFACGGGTPLKNKNYKLLKKLGKNIFLDVKEEVLLERIIKDGIPAFFPFPDNPQKSLKQLLKERVSIYQKLAELSLSVDKETPEEIVDKIIKTI